MISFLKLCLAQLYKELVSVQEKRHSLKTVIDMFAPGDTAATVPVATLVQPPEAFTVQQAESNPPRESPVVQDVTNLELNGANIDTAEAETPTASTPQKQKAKKNSSSTTRNQHPLRSQVSKQILGNSM